MTADPALTNRPPAARIDVAPLTRPDHADYLSLLALSTASERPSAEAQALLAMPPLPGLCTHGPALCLTARPHRSSNPKLAGVLFASLPPWAYDHPVPQREPGLSPLLRQSTICVYGVAVTPAHRRRGIARALLTEVEARARHAGYRMATLLHAPELTAFYQHMGYTSARHITIHTPHGAMGLTQPSPCLTAVKPLHPEVQVRHLPGAPGPVICGLLPGCGWDLPPYARFHRDHIIA